MRRKFFIALELIILYILFTPLAFADDSDRIVAGANRLYKAGKYDEALKSYNEAMINAPDSCAINYNIGTAHFKKGEYELAVGSFEKALLSSDKSLENKANYNIGNSKYKLGKLKENTDLANTVELLKESLDYYKRAIELNSNDKAAKLNHELVEKELKILLDKLKQQQQNKDKQKEDNQKQGPKDKQQPENKQKDQSGEQNSQEKKQAEEQKQQEEQTEAQKNEQSQAQEKQAQMNKTQEANNTQAEEANETAASQEDSREMSAQEANMLLDGYRQEENAKGEIKDATRGYPADVLKDW